VKVAAIEFEHLERWHTKISQRAPSQANRALAALGTASGGCVRTTRCAGSSATASSRASATLSVDELMRLTAALAAERNQDTADVFRLLLLIRFLERTMPKPYSVDLRARVIGEVETGASRREAAERYGISPSVVVIWVQRFEGAGSVSAKPSGRQHLAAGAARGVSAGSDCQPAGPYAERDRRGDAQSRSAVWRFFARRNISFKKKLCTRLSRSVPM
jgi:transposase